ncbi:hypothetical protein [Bradyrhizobium sp. RT4b]|uniref:hypothetical protein n=1 Tax=Bradyrhizobium sp. RT4b TaxID=3156379 RepID=UPI0033981B78
MTKLVDILLLPPLAIARLGDSKIPIDAFEWVDDPNAHGGGQTVIRPSVTLDVQSDGSVRPRIPAIVQFRDAPGAAIRPTAPFFEVWARFDDGQDARPLTNRTLTELGGSLERISWQVSVANLKAARRTKNAACGFSAEVKIAGDDHKARPLLAISPNVAGTAPLVHEAAPISLGAVQVVRPSAGTALGVDLDILRLRFTPAAGEVYGPPAATVAADPDAPATSIAQYEIVPAANRVLNAAAVWCTFQPQTQPDQPEPPDTFDGVIDLPDGSQGGQSWGIVDDTCDGIVRVVLEIGAERFSATARVTSGPPDFAPDRRPFASLANDLADRELPELTSAEIADPVTIVEVADLMRRVFETVSLTNLDALRTTMLRQNGPGDGAVPHTDSRSMTAADAPLADQVPAILAGSAGAGGLGYTLVAHDVHSALIDVDNMITLFRTQGPRLKHLIRPPFARFADLPAAPLAQLPTDPLNPGAVPVLRAIERDPRQLRDQQHDMRMPPYMRDADAFPLSLSWRQYRAVIALIDKLSQLSEAQVAALSPVRQHVARVGERRQQAMRPGSGATAT